MSSMNRQKDKTLKDELPRSVGAQYATGDQWTNNPRKNEETEPKQKNHCVVDVTGDGSKVQCYKSNIAKEPRMLIHESSQIGSGQTGDGKTEHQHFKNQ